MDLAKRDKQIQHLQNIIKENEQFLYDRQKELMKLKKHNPFLKDVVDQYNIYFSNIDQQNQAQYNALQSLADYITGLMLDQTSDATMIRHCKEDLKMVKEELNFLEKRNVK